jgi:hypothetical protein
MSDETENLKYQLQTLSSYEPRDLDDPEFEVLYENSEGEEGFATVCCVDIGQRSLDRIEELEARLKVDALYPNCREYLSQQTCRINACIKHIEERYDSQEPWTTPEEVKAILRGGSE